MRPMFLVAGALLPAISVLAEDKGTVISKSFPRVKMETTLGDIVIELNAEKAPISTKNFLTYVHEKYYDGTVFHRVIPTFMIQGGGFDENLDQKRAGLHPPIKNEWKNGLKNVRGSIAMARTSAPDSATAQFFINVVDNSSLDQPRGGAAYAVFGKVVEGMGAVDTIRDTDTENNPKYRGGKVVPVTPVVIKTVREIGTTVKKASSRRDPPERPKGGK